MAQTKISYDREEDILSISRGKKARYSIEIGDFIVDIDHQGLVSGIEIQNASVNIRVTKSFLTHLQKFSMTVNYKPGFANIHLMLLSAGKEKAISIPLSLEQTPPLANEVTISNKC